MLQKQSQIKVSEALMNKRVQPICAAAERERFYSMSEKKAKQTTHWVVTLMPQRTKSVGHAISLGNQWLNQLLVKIHGKTILI